MIKTEYGNVSLPEERNVEMLARVLNHIENNQEDWYQGMWAKIFPAETAEAACKTAFCFAGWTAVFSGAEQPTTSEEAQLWALNPDLSFNTQFGSAGRATRRALRADGVRFIRDWAGVELGLTACEADMLFEQGNNLARICKLATALIAGVDIVDEHHDSSNHEYAETREFCTYGFEDPHDYDY